MKVLNVSKSLHKFIIVAILICGCNAIYADPVEGLRIAKEMDRRETGYKDQTANLKMVLKNRQGQSSLRELTISTLEQKNDGDKSIVEFHEPKDVSGTRLLTFTHKVKDDDQWLYLPALRRVKRISSRSQSGPFMGSEFAYEDMGSQEVEKYTYNYIKDENISGQNCYLVERVPVNPYSGYKKQNVWIDKAEYRVQKVDFYDRKNSLLKTLDYRNYKKYQGKFWRAHDLDMKNHQTQKSTSLEWREFRFNTGLKDSQFTQSKLSR